MVPKDAHVVSLELDWVESLEIGVEEIDRDHKVLFEDANAIIRTFNAPNGPERLLDVIRKMKRDCVDHFRREEAILRRDGFAEVERHAAEHRRIEREMDDILATLEDFSGPANLMQELAMSFRTILLDHVLRYDLKYKSHLLYKRGR